jgi:hypothetical protein
MIRHVEVISRDRLRSDLISTGASVNLTLGGSDNAQNGRMTDVEAPSDTLQTFPVDVPSPGDLADLVASVCSLRSTIDGNAGRCGPSW